MAAAADARATQLVAGSAALAAAFAGAAALFAAEKLPIVGYGAAAGGIAFTVVAGLAIWAARPETKYPAPGMEPSYLWVVASECCLIAIGEAQRGIVAAGRGTIDRGKRLTRALYLAAAAPGVAVLVGVMSWLLGA